jgi:hypothetical protein
LLNGHNAFRPVRNLKEDVEWLKRGKRFDLLAKNLQGYRSEAAIQA